MGIQGSDLRLLSFLKLASYSLQKGPIAEVLSSVSPLLLIVMLVLYIIFWGLQFAFVFYVESVFLWTVVGQPKK